MFEQEVQTPLFNKQGQHVTHNDVPVYSRYLTQEVIYNKYAKYVGQGRTEVSEDGEIVIIEVKRNTKILDIIVDGVLYKGCTEHNHADIYEEYLKYANIGPKIIQKKIDGEDLVDDGLFYFVEVEVESANNNLDIVRNDQLMKNVSPNGPQLTEYKRVAIDKNNNETDITSLTQGKGVQDAKKDNSIAMQKLSHINAVQNDAVQNEENQIYDMVRGQNPWDYESDPDIRNEMKEKYQQKQKASNNQAVNISNLGEQDDKIVVNIDSIEQNDFRSNPRSPLNLDQKQGESPDKQAGLRKSESRKDLFGNNEGNLPNNLKFGGKYFDPNNGKGGQGGGMSMM